MFIVKRCLKVITSEIPKLISVKGCDASNVYDEEIPKLEQEYSDDELEKLHKK